ncbi:MAG: DUF4230 domain-containing protein [Ferruginibacter sp.]|nr:DUF4230 domain-containing protein [Cytophagales bacterium]
MRLLRFLVRLLSLAGVVVFLVWVGRNCTGKAEESPTATVTNQTVILQEVTAMGKLELVKYNFKDVVEHEIVKQWLPNPRAILIISGEAIGCIDLTKITRADLIQTPQDTLIIYLPEPELCVNKINHERSKVYNVEYAMFEEGQLVSEAYAKAEKQIGQSAQQMGILAQTKGNAEQILKPLLERVSGRKVLLRYRTGEKIELAR